MTLNTKFPPVIFLVAQLFIITNFTWAQSRPTACVFEYSDQWTQSLGAAEYLTRADFQVIPLPLDQSPLTLEVDMILFGSFASQSPAYQTYMKQFAEDLYQYVEQGHLLVHMVQADQTEKAPPFLPASQNARRADQDFARTHVLSPNHPLLTALTFPENIIEFHPRVTIWETFVYQNGFEVILAGDDAALYPALMEGAHGLGRIILSSLALDKKSFGSFGEPTSAIEPIRTAFFHNLALHALAVRNQKTKPLNITPSPLQVQEFIPGSWSLVLLPDTQLYSQSYPGIFLAQTAWIVQNHSQRNIQFVLQLGDITNNNAIREWENARQALTLMDGKVPYAFCPGNHDYGPGGNASTRATYMNEYLPAENYSSLPTFGGCMEPGKMDNTYHLFSAAGHDWIVLALEWAPRDRTVAWAHTIMEKHPNRLGIMMTHAYLNNNDLRYDHTDTVNPQRYNPHLYNTPGTKNDGRQLWEKLIKKHDFVFVFNGHVLGDGAGYLASPNEKGNIVHQILANYQMRELGGQGYLRLLEFLPDGKTVRLKTYSPIFDNFLLQPDQQFTIEIDLNAG